MVVVTAVVAVMSVQPTSENVMLSQSAKAGAAASSASTQVAVLKVMQVSPFVVFVD